MARWNFPLLKDITVPAVQILDDDILIRRRRGSKSSQSYVIVGQQVKNPTLEEYFVCRIKTEVALPLYICDYLRVMNPMENYENHKGMLASLDYDSFIAHTKIPVPNMSYQRAILDLGEVLHNKRTINNKIVQTLKDMSKNLYRQLTQTTTETQPICDIVNTSSLFFSSEEEVESDGRVYIDPQSILTSDDFDSHSYGEKLITWGKIEQADFLLENEYHFGRNDYTILSPKVGLSPLFVYCSAKFGRGTVVEDEFAVDRFSQFHIAKLNHEQLQYFHQQTNAWFYKIQKNFKENVLLEQWENTIKKMIYSTHDSGEKNE
ncbi:hypothetical protein [Candidatus Uabimicrobium amorphum]|uniref:Type I restriction-modification system subunit S n=1 Tax=Uabimicrobium amorphum TaxID=2596890 RepID=A0A5S9IKK6_UABAM|nr:hypothetical protein [Candidatus Uabimicrobium amorphum]BBM82770.1 type I restriction-modification system subunit S [Candidatus Uabimicrobium amorphum]